MKKLITLFFFLLYAGIQVAFTQVAITGTITKADDNTVLSGVTVLLKGTNVSALSDEDGNYAISVPDQNAVLLFTHVGYVPLEGEVGGQSTVSVSLVETGSEIVVTALGIERDSRTLGYAITSVHMEDLLVNRSVNMMESLEGKIAGMNITIPAAGVGSSSQIRLRGQTGFAGNAPLIVINGLPMDQDARGANGNNMRDLGDNLSSIIPDDIESMTILKGTTAAAIYGSRAANGAVIITTKSGQKNQGINIEYSGSFIAQQALNYMDEIQYIYGQGMFGNKPTSAADAAITGQFGWGARMDGDPVPIFDGSMQSYSPNKDNLFKYYRTGKVLMNTVAFSGGNDKGSFRASYSNTNSDGIDPFNVYKRNTANLGVNYNIADKLVFTVNFNYSNEKYFNPPEVGQQGPGAVNFFTRLSSSIPFDALKNSATNPVTGTEAQTSGFQGTVLNPYYAYQDANQRFENTRDRFLGSIALRYDIANWLYVQGRFNYNYLVDFVESKVPGGIGTSQPQYLSDGTYKGSYTVTEGKGTDINTDLLIGINKNFDRFSLNAFLGGNSLRINDHNFNQAVTNFVVRDFFSVSNGTQKNQSYNSDKSRINSFYGLAELGYNSTFYLSFAGRNDWLSVLPTNKSKFYPSVTGSFVFSKLLKNLNWLGYAKLRGSWAKAGNGPGSRPENLINSDFDTGTVNEKEIGLEARLLNNKLHFDVAAFNKVSSDQGLLVAVSSSSGLPQSVKNVGSLRNCGIEFIIDYLLVETHNLRWTTSWNNSFLKTEVLSVGENSDGSKIKDLLIINFNSAGNEFLGELHYTVGKPMNQLYTRRYLRNENGDIVVRSNGRLQATADYQAMGSSIPKFTGGWNNTIKFKNLTFSVFVDYKLGGSVLSATNLNLTRQGFSNLSLEGRRDGESGVVFPGVYDADPDPDVTNWQPNTTAVTDLQTFYGDYRNLQIGDPFTFKSDFVKLRSVSVSYDFTQTLNRVKFLGFVKGIVLTASCRNLAILYKDIPNLDPEAVQSSGDLRTGYENAALPTTRNFMFTMNAKF